MPRWAGARARAEEGASRGPAAIPRRAVGGRTKVAPAASEPALGLLLLRPRRAPSLAGTPRLLPLLRGLARRRLQILLLLPPLSPILSPSTTRAASSRRATRASSRLSPPSCAPPRSAPRGSRRGEAESTSADLRPRVMRRTCGCGRRSGCCIWSAKGLSRRRGTGEETGEEATLVATEEGAVRAASAAGTGCTP